MSRELGLGRPTAGLGLAVSAEGLLLGLPPQKLERPGHDRCGIAVRDLTTHQVLQAA